MHERSLVMRLIELVDDELSRRDASRLKEVHVEIGEFAGIEPALLESAFEELAADHWDHPVSLRLDVVPLTASCERCGIQFQIEQFHFICPQCHSALIHVIRGEEFALVSLTVHRPDSVKAIP